MWWAGVAATSEDDAKLFVSSTSLTSWPELTTPTYWYGGTTYQSKLGGIETSTELVTYKLYTLSNSDEWQPSLPPMPTAHWCPSAVNLESADAVLVSWGAW